MYWHSQGRSRSRRMPKSISVYTTVLLHSSDGLRDERKRNALTLSSIANLHPCINGGRHGGYGRGWRPTIASSKANFCSVAGVLSRPAVLFLYVPPPPPGILDPLPSLSPSKKFQTASIIFMQFGPEMHFLTDKYQSKPIFDLCNAYRSNFSPRHVHWGREMRPQRLGSLHRILSGDIPWKICVNCSVLVHI